MDLQHNCKEDIKSSSRYYSFNKVFSILHSPNKNQNIMFLKLLVKSMAKHLRNKRFRGTLETGNRDIHRTWINVSNPENTCSHTYKSSSFILNLTLLMCPHVSVSVGCPDIQLGRWWCCLLPFTQKTAEIWEPLNSSPTAQPSLSGRWTAQAACYSSSKKPVGDATYLSRNKPFNIFPVYEY